MNKGCWGGLLLLLTTGDVLAADLNGDPSNYRNLLNQLGPGDRLILAAGEYAGLPVDGLDGQAGNRIVITGPETGAPAVITGRSCCNTISVRNSSYVTIRYLDVDMRGELVDGLKAEGDAQFAHNITVEYLNFYGFGQDQQIVGINTKCPAWDWTIRHNTIYDAGTGLYLGNSTGGEPFVRGTIEFNLVVDPIGYGMQIKHQNVRPNGIGLPTGNSVTYVRHNVFMKASNASTGGNARPNLLIGDVPPSGAGAQDRYEIYGNLFYENQSGSEALFQGEGRYSFHDNVLINTYGTAIYAQNHNGLLRDVSFYHNTIFAPASGIEIYDGNGFSQLVVANAIFSDFPITNGTARDNLTGPDSQAASYFNNTNTNLGQLDLHPSNQTARGAAVDMSPFFGDTDIGNDFNGTVRDHTWRGAYSGAGNNPGWMLAEEIKVLMGGPGPGPDAGIVDTGSPNMDAGTPGMDAMPMQDAGFPLTDAGFDPTKDGGSGVDASVDGGSSRVDSGGGRVTEPRTRGGCGCNASEQTTTNNWWLSLLFLVLFVRLRRIT